MKPAYTLTVHQWPHVSVAVLQAGLHGRVAMGDLVLHRPSSDGWQCLVVDFMGHGPEAGRWRRALENDARTALELLPPSVALRTFNRTAFDRLHRERSYATAVCVHLQCHPHPTLTIAGAGHIPPIAVWTDGLVRQLPVRGLMLGVYKDYVYVDQRVDLSGWRALVLCTDGLLDMVSDHPAPGGMAELEEAVRLHGESMRTAAGMATGVFDSLAQIRTREIRDDVTLIVVTPEPLLSSLGGGATSLTVARRLLIVGRVQGVGFRAAARRQALALGLCGWVRNLPDGRVEAWAEGDAAAVKAFEDWCRQGPPAARVDRVEAEDAEPARHASFFIR